MGSLEEFALIEFCCVHCLRQVNEVNGGGAIIISCVCLYVCACLCICAFVGAVDLMLNAGLPLSPLKSLFNTWSLSRK